MPSYYYANMPISTLNNHMRKGSIDIDPSYQRSIVWNSVMQSHLIETLLEGFPIPSINLVENNDPSIPKFECMDGKNRLFSIQSYMNDSLSVNGTRFSERSEDEKEDFKAINIQVCIFKNLNYDLRRDYFRRIQEGCSLTQCEIIWSMEDKPLVNMIRKVRSSKLEVIEKLWETDRYSDLTYLCNLIAVLIGSSPNRDCAGHSTSMKLWVSKTANDENYIVHEKVMKHIIDVTASLLRVNLTKKAKHCFVIDLSRYIFYTKKPNQDKVDDIVEQINRYFTLNENPEDHNILDYCNYIEEGAASKQYSKNAFEVRMEIFNNFF